MQWTTYGSSRDLWRTQITEDELHGVRRKTEAFLPSCKRYSVVSKGLAGSLCHTSGLCQAPVNGDSSDYGEVGELQLKVYLLENTLGRNRHFS